MEYKFKLIQKATPFIPKSLRALIRRHVSIKEYDYELAKSEIPFSDTKEKIYPASPVKMGIIEEVASYHKYFITACRDMNISYQIIDLTSSDWINAISQSNCDAFLVWPSISNTALKELLDTRLFIMEQEMGKRLYPTWKECWLYENKPRLLDWLNINNIQHPQSWVFYNQNSAYEFASKASLPVVAKTATGASASGIQIIRSLSGLHKIIKKAFSRGLTPRGFHPGDRQWGFIYFQEYIPDIHEWRMVRIGDSFFGYRKERGSDGLHSASHNWSWLDPGDKLLDLLKAVTDAGPFTSMDVDIFETPDGQLLINELQTVFGCTTPEIQMKVNDIPGRYIKRDGKWEFEEGDYFRNHMCNMRIEYLCNILTNKAKE